MTSDSSIVIDIGSGLMRLGFSEDHNEPRSVIDTMIGRPKNLNHFTGGEVPQEIYFGSDLGKFQRILNFRYPIEHGAVKHWNDFDRLIEHSVTAELNVLNPEDYGVFLLENTKCSKDERERKVSRIFESKVIKEIPRVYLGKSAVCCLPVHENNNFTGLVIDAGFGKTEVTPVYEGHPIYHASQFLPLGIMDIISELTQKTTSYFEQDRSMLWIRKHFPKVVRKICYFSESYDEELREKHGRFKQGYKFEESGLNEKMDLGCEIFQAPEIIFQPDLCGHEKRMGLIEMIRRSVHKCDNDLEDQMLGNIVVTGGMAGMKGFKERIYEGVKTKFKHRMSKVKYARLRSQNVEPTNASWVGAATLLCSGSFENQQWITKEEYDDHGATIVHRKCF